jgi:hypothetical protein
MRIDVIHLRGLQQRGDGCPGPATAMAAREERIFSGDGHHPNILPKSGWKSRSITNGIRCFARRVRWHYRERRTAGDFVHVEIAPGEVIAVPVWMLDPSACAGMVLGTPRVTLAALIDLQGLLTERGFRRDSSTDSSTGEEKQDDQSAKTDRRTPAFVANRIAPAQHCVRNHSDTGYPRPSGPRSLRIWPTFCCRPPTPRRGMATMTNTDLLPATVLKRKAVVYVRQSSQSQVRNNLERQRRQYDLVEEARRREFRDIEVIDDDLGRSASGMVARPGFDRLVAPGKSGPCLLRRFQACPQWPGLAPPS